LFNGYLRVSSDADVSDDEEDEQDNGSYDSFIDDRINPTASSSPAESCRIDMMAIYRCFYLFSLFLSMCLLGLPPWWVEARGTTSLGT
jgi:hypothetical protein